MLQRDSHQQNKIEQNKLIHIAQGILLFLAMTLVAMRSDADELGEYLEQLFAEQNTASFIHYESVQAWHAEDFGQRQYLVLDFSLNDKSGPSMQRTIHTLCSSLLKDIALVTELSHRGYSMVAVSFDRHSQYDCL
jgi:hypothetical protein